MSVNKHKIAPLCLDVDDDTVLYCSVCLSVWVALVQNDLHLVEAKTDRDVGASGTKRGAVFEFADK
jgi:hypothetical protein